MWNIRNIPSVDFQSCCAGSMMGQYLPFANRHSIQEVVVGLHFHEVIFPGTVKQALFTAKTEWKDELPRISESQVQEIRIDPNHSTTKQAPQLAGFELSKVKPNAKPARVVRLMENRLTVNFFEYQN